MDNGEMVKSMESDVILLPIAIFMRVSSLMGIDLDKVNIPGLMEVTTKENGEGTK